MDIATKLLHTGAETDPYTGAVSVPIYQVSTFDQKEELSEYEYSRSGNPTRAALESIIAQLEGGVAGFAFSSGMAAIAAVTLLFGNGDHILAPKDVYGGTYRILSKACGRWGISYNFIDTTDFEQIVQAVQPNTKAILLESPSNPLLKVSDLPKICAWAKERGLITIVDNTFMTPYLQRPIEFGADIVVHSATKFLGGHSDVVAGLAVAGTKELANQIGFLQNTLGGILGPQDSWLIMRGIKTLKVRMDFAQQGALKIAQALAKHPKVKHVFYPGLPDDPGHMLLKSQADGFGAVLSFELQTPDLARQLMTKVKYPAVAVSLGGVESILSYPATMSHASVPPQERSALGISDALLRLSVGLESPDDLLEDLFAVLE
ncbi:Cystathionine gamma-lyase [bioreactor metagenome]|uniref:cysteine-S-conjugate beta-lyase n=1 Tax=bioreactor metagenome TaxID=1076179 RepID=A0A644TM86_9ZZZZ|nr:PLP-dependent aspartate aminotransferase family protein [Negativicutes bacterium]